MLECSATPTADMSKAVGATNVPAQRKHYASFGVHKIKVQITLTVILGEPEKSPRNSQKGEFIRPALGLSLTPATLSLTTPNCERAYFNRLPFG